MAYRTGWTFKKTWKLEARNMQGSFYKDLGRNGQYHRLKSPWQEGLSQDKRDLRYLIMKTKLLFGFFGPLSSKKTLYNSLENIFVERVIDIIHDNYCDSELLIAQSGLMQRQAGFEKIDRNISIRGIDNPEINEVEIIEDEIIEDEVIQEKINAFEFTALTTNRSALSIEKESSIEYVGIAFVFILMRCNRKTIPVPILRFQAGLSCKFIDTTGTLYQSWQDFKNSLTDENQRFRYCCPENGVYTSDSDGKPNLCFISGKCLPSYLKHIPELMNPNDKKLNELHCIQYCSSELFFFNRYFDPIKLWETVKKHVKNAVSFLRGDLNREQTEYWENNVTLGNPDWKYNAYLCLRDVGLEALTNQSLQFNISINFLENGWIEINDEIVMNPENYVRLSEKDLEKINRYTSEDGNRLNEPKIKNNSLFSNFKIAMYQEEIRRLLGYRCSFARDTITIKTSEDVELSDHIRLDQIKKLNDLLNNEKGNPNLIDIYILLIENQFCTNLKDLLFTIQSVILLKNEIVKNLIADYEANEKEERECKEQQNEEFDEVDFKRRWGILECAKTYREHFLEIAIEQIRETLVSFLDQCKWQCLNNIKRHNFRFACTMAAVQHFLKHRYDFNNPDMCFRRYLALVQNIMNQDQEPKITVMDGNSKQLIFTSRPYRVICYEYLKFEPDGSRGVLRIVSSCY